MTKKTAMDEKAMISCFTRRKDGIKKKTRELSILCDVKACAIVIGPDGKIETWPENSAGVLDVIRGFQSSGSHKPSPGRSAAVSGKRASGSNEATDHELEQRKRLMKLEAEEEEEEYRRRNYHHIPNVSEFDEWVNSNWTDRTSDAPKQEMGFLQMLLGEKSDDQVLIHSNPGWFDEVQDCLNS